MSISQQIIVATTRAASQAITGNLLSNDLIEAITKEAVRQLFPKALQRSEEELQASARVDVARRHITQATDIILSLKDDLEQQSRQLDALAADIAEKQTQAEHYAALLKADKATFDAYKVEVEKTVRDELIRQSEQGKRIRQIGSAIFWIFNLFVGAAIGAYFLDIVAWAKSVLPLLH